MALRTNMSAFTKAASATCIAGAVAFTVLAGSLSASAAPVTCESLGATTIAPGICQIVITTSGTFTAPAGVTNLEALLVAGGSAGNNGYDGGVSGGVLYVDSLPVGIPLTLTVGAGGVYAGDGPTGTGYGTGATGDSVEPLPTSLYGTGGVLPSAFVAGENPASTLFPAYAGEAPVAGDGQQGDDDIDGTEPVATSQSSAGGGTNGAFVSALANTGSGGGGATLDRGNGDITNPGNGGSGVIILRFAAPEAAVSPALAATGTDSTLAAGAAGALLLGGAVALAATAAKRRRSARA